MRKTVFIAVLFTGLAGFSKAQNAVSVDVGKGICIDEFQIHYKSGSSNPLELGCTGAYRFDTGKRIADGIVINGVICYKGEWEVTLRNGTTVTVNNSIQDESKGFSSLIR